MQKLWKSGRGKLGFLSPLLGAWIAESDSPMGPVRCRRGFTSVLEGAYVRLEARWEIGAGKTEAHMPAGFARMAYWPDGAGGVRWVVESKSKKGWNRFTEHLYKPA